MPGLASRTAVQRAVDEFGVTAFQLHIDSDAHEAASESLNRSGLLLLGEVHGVRQNALAVRALMDALGATGLALEWPAGLAPAVSSFLADGQVVDHPQLWGGDGRITVGHFALLRERFSAGLLSALTLFDGVSEVGWSRREAAMADRILAATEVSGARRTLVVAGSAHTPLTPTGLGVPLGARLVERLPGVREIRIRYGNGSYYNLTPQRFKRHWTLRTRPKLHMDGNGLVLELPNPVQARVPHRTQTGAQPALRGWTGMQPALREQAGGRGQSAPPGWTGMQPVLREQADVRPVPRGQEDGRPVPRESPVPPAR